MIISVYAESAKVASLDDTQVEVTLIGVDVDNVIKEFSYTDVLDTLEFPDIMNYVTERQKEDKEDGQ